MDASLEERMLRLAQELAISHGTFFAAALLADVGVPFPVALVALGGQPYAKDGMGRGVRVEEELSEGIATKDSGCLT